MKQESMNIEISVLLLFSLSGLLNIVETNILNREICYLLQFMQDGTVGLDGVFQAQAASDGHLYYCR